MKHRRTREIVIELTSLLDVVMILIFAVLLQNAELLDKKNQEIAGIEAENEGVLEDMAGLQERVDELLGEKDKLLGEKDKLQEEKDKLAGELQEALEKGEVGDLLSKIESYENQLGALEAIKDYVYVYLITTARENNADHSPTIITYGQMNTDAKKATVAHDNKDGFANQIYNIEIEIASFIESNMTVNAENKYFYIVLSMDRDDNYTYVYNIIDENKIKDYLNNRFNNNQHIYVVTKK